eukprot:TRINITY_DN233_c0_g3_i2.p1 TRINITY_DN233_c0_g3~~TRINITY_DN233_c0_g3_i2.p1  ORF type:complete len:425 (+),score=133.12 TRINITY_DN233_c0_g3_i2:83-1357(+)
MPTRRQRSSMGLEENNEPKKARSGVAVGDMIPDMELETDESTPENKITVNLKSVAAEAGLVLFFYPKAATPGCTKQACGFRDYYKDLLNKGYQVFGMSADKPKAQANWKNKQDLPYTLLCDTNFEFMKAIGIMKGPKSIKRSHIVVDKGGVISTIEISLSPQKSVDLVVEKIIGDVEDEEEMEEEVEEKQKEKVQEQDQMQVDEKQEDVKTTADNDQQEQQQQQQQQEQVQEQEQKEEKGEEKEEELQGNGVKAQEEQKTVEQAPVEQVPEQAPVEKSVEKAPVEKSAEKVPVEQNVEQAPVEQNAETENFEENAEGKTEDKQDMKTDDAQQTVGEVEGEGEKKESGDLQKEEKEGVDVILSADENIAQNNVADLEKPKEEVTLTNEKPVDAPAVVEQTKEALQEQEGIADGEVGQAAAAGVQS